MELAQPLIQLETAEAAVLAARPTLVDGTQGIDITPWKVGGYSHVNLSGYIQKNGADVNLTGPAGSATANAVEVWGMKARKSGTKFWWLEGYLNGGIAVPVVGAGGFVFSLTLSTMHERLVVVGTSSDGAHIPTHFFEPLEHMLQTVG